MKNKRQLENGKPLLTELQHTTIALISVLAILELCTSFVFRDWTILYTSVFGRVVLCIIIFVYLIDIVLDIINSKIDD